MKRFPALAMLVAALVGCSGTPEAPEEEATAAPGEESTGEGQESSGNGAQTNDTVGDGAEAHGGGSDDDWEFDGDPVVMTQLPFQSDAGFAIARAEGWFDDAGIEVEVVNTRSANEMLPLLASGEIDVMFMSTAPALFNVIGAGEPIRAVATGTVFAADSCDYLAVVVPERTRQERDVTDPESLRGMRIGGSFTVMTSIRHGQAVLAELGLEEGDIELVEVDRASMAGALQRGDIDAAAAYEPWITQIAANADVATWFPAHELITDEVGAVVVFGQRLLEDTELGARVLAQYVRGVEQYERGATPRNIEILEETSGLDPELLEEMCWPTLRVDGRASEAQMTDLQEFGVEAGLVDGVLPPDQLWDHSFLDRAREILDAQGSSPGA